MLVPETTSVRVGPENFSYGLEDLSEELLCTVRPPEPVQAEHQKAFIAALDAVLPRFEHSEARRYAAMAAETIRWAWFDGSQQPLPEGIVGGVIHRPGTDQLIPSAYTHIAPEISPHSSALKEIALPWEADTIHDLLADAGLQTAIDERKHYFEEQRPAALQVAARLIRSRPTYQNLAIHLINAPLANYREWLLSERTRAARVAALRSRAEAEMCAPFEVFQYDPHAVDVVHAFQVAVQGLDEATEIRRVARENAADNPWSRLRTDILHRVSKHEQRQAVDISFKDADKPYLGFMIQFAAGEPKVYEDIEVDFLYGDDYSIWIRPSAFALKMIAGETADYEEELERLVDEEAKKMVACLDVTKPDFYRADVTALTRLFDSRLTVHLTTEQLRARRRTAEQVHVDAQREALSPKQFWRLYLQRLGTVLEDDTDWLCTNRLLQWVVHDEDLPESHSDARLRIRWNNMEMVERFVPRIPGYILVARRGNEFGFARDPAGDPYADANMPIPCRIGELAERYESADLPRLASGLCENVTVKDFIAMLADRAKYSIRNAYRVSRKYPDARVVRTIAAVGVYAVRGRPAYTCDAAAGLAAASLDVPFGPATSVMTGYVIPAGGKSKIRKGKIRGLKHAQTRFDHEGNTYILDATPPSWLPSAIGLSPNRKERVKPPATQDFDKPKRPTPLVQASEFQEDPPAILRALEDQLCKVYGLPVTDVGRHHMYGRLTRLIAQDPILRTIRIARHAASVGGILWPEPVDPQEIRRAARFIRNYGKVATRPNPHGLPPRDPRLLSVLEGTLSKLLKAVQLPSSSSS